MTKVGKTEWHLKVKISNKLLKKLPIKKLESRYAMAVVLSFYGDSMEVLELMQRLSHGTRAYFFNEEGLKGFLTPSIT